MAMGMLVRLKEMRDFPRVFCFTDRMSEGLEVELATVRDWLRYAVSRFGAAGLVYGHGSSTALDEAAYLILHALHLPIDQLDPWLDARLLPEERQALNKIIEARITSRKPAAYITKEAWIQGYSFYVDERVIVPRSYIGELLCKHMAASDEGPLGLDTLSVNSILDLCTGSGCLAILAALAFPNATVDASDICEGALAVAERNVRDYGLEQRISLSRSDLFVAHAGQRYDLIIANPPYVGADALAAFPAEYAAEPRIAHDGGGDGLGIVRRILAGAGAYLSPAAALLVEVGTGRATLEQEFPRLPFLWLDTAESEGEVFMLSASALRPGRSG
jgi:ribosomal protein L3 glutamine methyltransferase